MDSDMDNLRLIKIFLTDIHLKINLSGSVKLHLLLENATIIIKLLLLLDSLSRKYSYFYQ